MSSQAVPSDRRCTARWRRDDARTTATFRHWESFSEGGEHEVPARPTSAAAAGMRERGAKQAARGLRAPRPVLAFPVTYRWRPRLPVCRAGGDSYVAESRSRKTAANERKSGTNERVGDENKTRTNKTWSLQSLAVGRLQQLPNARERQPSTQSNQSIRRLKSDATMCRGMLALGRVDFGGNVTVPADFPYLSS